jgi:hypothetical protein
MDRGCGHFGGVFSSALQAETTRQSRFALENGFRSPAAASRRFKKLKNNVAHLPD